MEQDNLLQELSLLTTKPVGLSAHANIFVPIFQQPPRSKILSSLRSLYSAGNVSLCPFELEKLMTTTFSNMKVTQDETEYIEQQSKLLSNSLIWRKQRIGRITASTAHDALHTSLVTPAVSILCHWGAPIP